MTAPRLLMILTENEPLIDLDDLDAMVEMGPLWEALAVHASEEFPEWVSRDDLALHRRLVGSLNAWWANKESMPHTLIHNDFNPRNICLRPTDDGPVLCAYDWELATLGLPQHDLAELLIFTLPNDVDEATVDHYIEFHRVALEQAVGAPIDPKAWQAGFTAALFDLGINRLALYIMAHTFRHYSFMERVVGTWRRICRLKTGF